jgi:CheY-like chemotaxis protein
MLETGGYTVLAAADPEDAIAKVRGQPVRIDCVLTDVVMPRMSGRELTRRLAAERPGLRVVFMSGYTDEAIGHHGVLDAGTHFIQKPFTQQALLRKLRDALDAPGD